MPIKTHQVFYFVALCEEQSFTRAAKRCGVAQPSLTRAIQTLEGEFGAPLFERSRSNVRLTPLGLLVRPDFERISQATTVLAQRITELKAKPSSKPELTSTEASMRATIAIVATVALTLLGLALHPTPSATAGALPQLARAPEMAPYILRSIDGVSRDKMGVA
jgi:LysR family transcriptional regulator, hydrogen peroxide-inducible genes activator